MLDLSDEQRRILRYERRERKAQEALDAMGQQLRETLPRNPGSDMKVE